MIVQYTYTYTYTYTYIMHVSTIPLVLCETLTIFLISNGLNSFGEKAVSVSVSLVLLLLHTLVLVLMLLVAKTMPPNATAVRGAAPRKNMMFVMMKRREEKVGI